MFFLLFFFFYCVCVIINYMTTRYSNTGLVKPSGADGEVAEMNALTAQIFICH